VLELELDVESKDDARRNMVRVTDLFRNWNYAATGSDEYQRILVDIDAFIATAGRAAAHPHGAPVAETAAVG